MTCYLTSLPSYWVVASVLLAGMIGFMSLWYLLALKLKRIDIVDSAWGLGFIYVALLAYTLFPLGSYLQFLTLGFVTAWGGRLFLHITLRNHKKTEDPRYVLYRQKWGNNFKLKAYTNIYLVQGILVLLISLPVFAILFSRQVHPNALGVVGFIVWGFGILFEAVADFQLRQFLKIRKKGEVMQRGLWRYSRHPNYFGEIVTWFGPAIVALSIGRWWGMFGSLLITFLIVKVSGIPPLEKRYADDKKYQMYKKQTSVLIPLPVRK